MYATNLCIQARGFYSTILFSATLYKRRDTIPHGLRCGSVETCRKAFVTHAGDRELGG